MKSKFIIPIIAATIITGCKTETSNCPQIVQVPFVSVEIPDSVEAGKEFTIDVKLYDYGCYTATNVVGQVLRDTVYLEAYANYDECGCPTISAQLQQAYRSKTDTSLHNTTLYYKYVLVNNTKDSVRACCDSVKFY